MRTVLCGDVVIVDRSGGRVFDALEAVPWCDLSVVAGEEALTYSCACSQTCRRRDASQPELAGRTRGPSLSCDTTCSWDHATPCIPSDDLPATSYPADALAQVCMTETTTEQQASSWQCGLGSGCDLADMPESSLRLGLWALVRAHGRARVLRGAQKEGVVPFSLSGCARDSVPRMPVRWIRERLCERSRGSCRGGSLYGLRGRQRSSQAGQLVGGDTASGLEGEL